MAAPTYAVLLEVPHSGGSAWHWAAANFEERLADQVIAPVLSADLVAEVRRGRDGLRLRISVIVRAAHVADAVSAAWDVLEAASDVGGFDLAGATTEAGPAPLKLASYRAPGDPGRRRRSRRARTAPPGRGSLDLDPRELPRLRVSSRNKANGSRLAAGCPKGR
jgi:hypothetical protein